jgi:hypothetical protein
MHFLMLHSQKGVEATTLDIPLSTFPSASEFQPLSLPQKIEKEEEGT